LDSISILVKDKTSDRF